MRAADYKKRAILTISPEAELHGQMKNYDYELISYLNFTLVISWNLSGFELVGFCVIVRLKNELVW